MPRKTKYVFITGGVVSSIGKGIAAASLGALLESRGLRVSIQKLDPYINVDPGTMSPFQHGEVFVTDDGAETDLDLGHYERFTGTALSQSSSVSTGQVYMSVVANERKGEYLGGTVQVIPHITDEIKRRIAAHGEAADVAIVEIGGTVGDIESLPFMEAIRQFGNEHGRDNVAFVHVTLVLYMKMAGELKSKPTQHSVKVLMERGITPDILLCRAEQPLPEDMIQKISLTCGIARECVIPAIDAPSIYTIPLQLHELGFDDQILKRLNIWAAAPRLDGWREAVARIGSPSGSVTIAVVGKYSKLKESYKSLYEALTHGGVAHDCRVNIRYVDAEAYECDTDSTELDGVDGILVPGGFGNRGVEGKVRAIAHARNHDIPFFGICLGMQLAAIEFARNACDIADACSEEFGEGTAVVHLMKAQQTVTDKGGTMRLGGYACRLRPGSLAADTYGEAGITERHRHRYEFNNAYRDDFEARGLVISGVSECGTYVEIIELPGHTWFLGCQFHPEFKSKLLRPHPLFVAFIGAALKRKAGRDGGGQ